MALSLRHLVEQLSFLTEHTAAYLEYKTNQIYIITDDEIDLAEEDISETDDSKDLIDIKTRVREVISSNAFINLPTKEQLGEIDILMSFCRSLEQPELRGEFVSAVSDDNPFARFRELRQKHQLENQWFEYWELALGKAIKAWLSERDIAFVDDITNPPDICPLKDEDDGYTEAAAINRSIAIVKPTEVYLSWARKCDDVPESLTLDDMRTDCMTFLIPAYNDQDEAEAFIREIFYDLFEMELESWNTDESTWPKKRDYATFREWFDLEFHSMVVDITSEELGYDEY